MDPCSFGLFQAGADPSVVDSSDGRQAKALCRAADCWSLQCPCIYRVICICICMYSDMYAYACIDMYVCFATVCILNCLSMYRIDRSMCLSTCLPI